MSELDEYNVTKKEVKNVIKWVIAVAIMLSAIGFLTNRSIKTVDNGIIHYEEFQELYNTCEKLNTDLCNMKDMPENDVSFKQFSKAQRINTIKTQLNRWVQDYNSKSKMWNRNIWKSSQLPYSLDVKQFECYNN